MIQIQNTGQLVLPWTTWFLYGPTGSGKTRKAATFPRPLFIVPTNESSHTTLLQLPQTFDYVIVGRDAAGVRVPVRQHMAQILSDLETRYQQMAHALQRGDEAAADALFPWETVVIESLTHYCDLVVEDISKFGQQQMDQRGWGLLATHVRTIHDRLANLDVHVVYTSLDKVEQKGEGANAAVMGKPNITGSLADKLPSACDVIAYCEMITTGQQQQKVFRTHFTRRAPFDARARFAFPDYVDDFDFARLVPLMGGHRGGQQVAAGTAEE